MFLNTNLPMTTPTSVGVFVRLVVNNMSVDQLGNEYLGYLILDTSENKPRLIGIWTPTAIRHALRQYIELCLNTRTLTQLGLQVPIKTIRQ
jgi:hypothetical protein